MDGQDSLRRKPRNGNKGNTNACYLTQPDEMKKFESGDGYV